MIDLSYVQEIVEMKKREEILKRHPYKIWEGKNGKFYTYITDEDGGRKLVKKSSMKALEDMLIGLYKQKDDRPKTFDDAYWRWREVQDVLVNSDNTPVKYDSDYNRYFKGTDFSKKLLVNISEDDIRIFVCTTTRNLKLSKKPTKTLYGYIARVILHARKNGYLKTNPTEFLSAAQFYQYCTPSERSKKKQTVDDADAQLLLDKLHEDHKKKPNYIPSYAVEFAFLTGMRVGEIAALKWEDITDCILIEHSEKYNRKTKEYFIDTTKNEKIREFPVTDEIKALLNTIKHVEMKYGYICEWVFANENGRIHAPMISSCIKSKCRQLGIEEKGIHALRKTLNSKMRNNGVSASVSAALLGHSEEVNREYYTFDVASKKEKHDIVAKVNHEYAI